MKFLKLNSREKYNLVSKDNLSCLWITNTQLYPSHHGCSVYINNLTSKIGEKCTIDLLYYIDENIYNENSRIYQNQFRNIFHVPHKSLEGGAVLDNGLNSYFNILSSELLLTIERLINTHQYDFIVCDYIYLAPIFDFVPNSIIKIINTHDIYGDRHISLNWGDEEKANSFCISEMDENLLLNKADIIITITDVEKEILSSRFSKLGWPKEIVCIKYIPKKNNDINFKLDDKSKKTLNIGFMGSSNPINTNGIKELFSYINSKNISGINFLLAGLICNKITDEYPWLTKLGVIDNKDLYSFYSAIDVFINPMPKNTTGLKIKTIECIVNNIPIIGTYDSFTGLVSNNAWHSFSTIDDLAESLNNFKNEESNINSLLESQEQIKNTLLKSSSYEISLFFQTIKYLKANKKLPTLNYSSYNSYINKKNILKNISIEEHLVDRIENNKIRLNNTLKTIELSNLRIDNLISALKPNYHGYVSITESIGLHPDSWCSKFIQFSFINSHELSSVKFEIIVPNNLKGFLNIRINSTDYKFEISESHSTLICDTYIKRHSSNKISIKSDIDSSVSGDSRDLSYIIKLITFN